MVSVTGFDWITVFKQFVAGPVAAVTTPRYLIQRVGAESPDGLGLVWQSNVFGHYSLVSRQVGIPKTFHLTYFHP